MEEKGEKGRGGEREKRVKKKENYNSVS